jgi:hypothetical protein
VTDSSRHESRHADRGRESVGHALNLTRLWPGVSREQYVRGLFTRAQDDNPPSRVLGGDDMVLDPAEPGAEAA